IDHPCPGAHLLPAGAAYPQHPSDSRRLDGADDACRPMHLVRIQIRILPARIEGTDEGVVSGDQWAERCTVVDVACLCNQAPAWNELARIADNGRYGVAAIQCLFEYCGTDEAARTYQHSLHWEIPRARICLSVRRHELPSADISRTDRIVKHGTS